MIILMKYPPPIASLRHRPRRTPETDHLLSPNTRCAKLAAKVRRSPRRGQDHTPVPAVLWSSGMTGGLAVRKRAVVGLCTVTGRNRRTAEAPFDQNAYGRNGSEH